MAQAVVTGCPWRRHPGRAPSTARSTNIQGLAPVAIDQCVRHGDHMPIFIARVSQKSISFAFQRSSFLCGLGFEFLATLKEVFEKARCAYALRVIFS
jgi:hypothetical protein